MRVSVLLAGSVCIIIAVWAQLNHLDGSLLRADPNAIPTNAALVAYARPRGHALYDLYCASCHGKEGGGDSGRGIPDLSDNDWLYGTGTVGDIEQIIRYGIRSYHPKTWNLAIMPAYATPKPSVAEPQIPSLSPANIRDLVEFLFLAQGRAADGPAAARGTAIFHGVGGCYDCHSGDAKGDSAIGAPNLTDGTTLYGDGSRDALAMSIAYGRHGVCPAWVTRISATGIRELAVFVFSLAHFPLSANSAPDSRYSDQEIK